MRSLILLMTAASVLVTGCRKEAVSQSARPAGGESRTVVLGEDGKLAALTGGWLKKESVRVVGYRYKKAPGGDQEFFLLYHGAVDRNLLKQVTVAEKELTRPEAERLLKGIFSKTCLLKPAACFEPHHLFLFFDAEDRMTNAIEICFGCQNINTWPDLEKDQWFRHDFRDLARLCEETGIGLEVGTAENYSKVLDAREAPKEESGE